MAARRPEGVSAEGANCWTSSVLGFDDEVYADVDGEDGYVRQWILGKSGVELIHLVYLLSFPTYSDDLRDSQTASTAT